MVGLIGYDAWRTTPPGDRSCIGRIVDYEFTREMEIWPLNETLADCGFVVSDGEYVGLDTVTIQGRTFSSTDFAEWLGQSEADRLREHAQDWWDITGRNEAEQDAADAFGDWAFEGARDARVGSDQ